MFILLNILLFFAVILFFSSLGTWYEVGGPDGLFYVRDCLAKCPFSSSSFFLFIIQAFPPLYLLLLYCTFMCYYGYKVELDSRINNFNIKYVTVGVGGGRV